MKNCKKNGRPKRGLVSSLTSQFSISRHTVTRIWKDAKLQIASNGTIDFTTKYATNMGRKRIELDLSKVAELPLHRRTNIRSIAKELNISKSSLHRRIKDGVIRRHTNAIKPYLTEENKKRRLRFCLSMIEKSSFMHDPMFIDMYDYVHRDEKWFYISKEAEKYYLLPDEPEPLRTCKSKRFLTKVMFLAAVGRPRFDPITGAEFSGKLGIFPFVYKEPAKRMTKNRPAGTMETKPIVSVTKEVYKAYLIEKVIPAILEKWPHTTTRSTVYIQQDNVKPHISVDDLDFQEATQKNGLNIELVCQPPNSPDMNVLDLGFFRAIQALQQQESLRNIDELVSAVEKAFNDLPSKQLNHVFISLQQCMIEVMKSQGCNRYKMPHMNKNRLEKYGNLPTKLSVAPELIEATKALLQD